MKKSVFLLISALLVFPCFASPSTGKVTFTTETLSDYYVWVESTKVSIDGFVTSDSGEIGFTLDKYNLPKQLADYAGTYVYIPEDAESVRTAHEEKLEKVPEQHRMSAQPAYRYRIQYKTGETTFIGGDLLFFWE